MDSNNPSKLDNFLMYAGIGTLIVAPWILLMYLARKNEHNFKKCKMYANLANAYLMFLLIGSLALFFSLPILMFGSDYRENNSLDTMTAEWRQMWIKIPEGYLPVQKVEVEKNLKLAYVMTDSKMYPDKPWVLEIHYKWNDKEKKWDTQGSFQSGKWSSKGVDPNGEFIECGTNVLDWLTKFPNKNKHYNKKNDSTYQVESEIDKANKTIRIRTRPGGIVFDKNPVRAETQLQLATQSFFSKKYANATDTNGQIIRKFWKDSPVFKKCDTLVINTQEGVYDLLYTGYATYMVENEPIQVTKYEFMSGTSVRIDKIAVFVRIRIEKENDRWYVNEGEITGIENMEVRF